MALILWSPGSQGYIRHIQHRLEYSSLWESVTWKKKGHSFGVLSNFDAFHPPSLQGEKAGYRDTGFSDSVFDVLKGNGRSNRAFNDLIIHNGSLHRTDSTGPCVFSFRRP